MKTGLYNLSAGAARVEITPPLTIPYLSSLPRHCLFKGVHAPLYARALAVSNGNCDLVIISADALGFSKLILGEGEDFTAGLRELISRECGVSAECILLAATHAHSTPDTCGFRRLTLGAQEWLRQLQGQLASAAIQAFGDRKAARLKKSIGSLEGVSRCRRLILEDGKLYWGVAPREAKVANPGRIDSDLTVLLFEREAAPGIALCHFTCHPVVVQAQPLISPDFPGYAMDFVERSGAGVSHCMFLQGATGQLDPLKSGSTFAESERIGHMMAGEIIKQAAKMSGTNFPEESHELGAASASIDLESRPLPERGVIGAEYDEARAALETCSSADERAASKRVLRVEEKLERIDRGTGPFCAEVQVLRIGDTALTGIPGEPFLEMGTELKYGTRAPHALTIGYANDYLGYFATPEAWKQGGYEVELGMWSYVGALAHGQLKEKATDLIRELWTKSVARAGQFLPVQSLK